MLVTLVTLGTMVFYFFTLKLDARLMHWLGLTSGANTSNFGNGNSSVQAANRLAVLGAQRGVESAILV